MNENNEKVLIATNTEMLGMLEELLREGKTVIIKIKGRSMQPLLRDGIDQVELSQPTDGEIKRKALVLIRYGDGFLLHRILMRKGNKLILRGDNVFQLKEETNTEQVVGIVRKIIYQGGKEIRTSSGRWKSVSICWLTIKPLIKVCLYFSGAAKRLISIIKK